MPSADSVNYLDLILGGLILAFFARGIFRGLVSELTGLVALVLAVGVASNGRIHSFAERQLSRLLEDASWVSLLSYLLTFAVPFVVVVALGRLAQRLMGQSGPGLASRLGGGAAGAAKGVVICTLLLIFLQFFSPDSQMKANSAIVPYINKIWASLHSWTGGFQHLPDFTRPHF